MTPPPEWPLRWLGRPWIAGVYECSDFVAEVLDAEFGRRPLMPRAGARRDAETMLAEAAHILARPTAAPRDGDLVLARARGRRIAGHHVGLWCRPAGRPAVLHCMAGAGACLHPLATLPARGFTLHGTWRLL